jgi:hypothetical protein
VHLVEKQVHPGGRRFGIGADKVLTGLLQSAPDLGGGVAGKPLHVPERKAAGDEQVEEHRTADDKNEFGAEGAQAQTSGLVPERAHAGLRPDAAQIGHPA